jgi:hypothetical protein
MRKALLVFCIFLQALGLAEAQSEPDMTRDMYFETYKELAIKEMHRSGVPASITLAQGALESGNGNSRLARRANNHFGIKCHDDWNGKTIHHNDDEKNECFRKYNTVEDSYRDHSDYLRSIQRYAFLFELEPTDYKGWAKGLKKAGYATNNSYAESLIRIIEQYDLYRFDTAQETGRPATGKPGQRSSQAFGRQILENNRIKYIMAKPGDSYESLADELGKLRWELPRYNDADLLDTISPGDVIYLQPKRNKAQAGRNVHIVKQGETMRSISQLYGIKLSRLYVINRLDPGEEPSAGAQLQLRKPLKSAPPKIRLNDQEQQENDEDEIKVDLNLD